MAMGLIPKEEKYDLSICSNMLQNKKENHVLYAHNIKGKKKYIILQLKNPFKYQISSCKKQENKA